MHKKGTLLRFSGSVLFTAREGETDRAEEDRLLALRVLVFCIKSREGLSFVH